MVFKHIWFGIFTFLFSCLDATASQYDTNASWPLCGRISEAPPQNWTPVQGCPSERFGNNDHTDAPISSTYGPRQLVSEGYRYDFHRGIDLATATGTPVFAITNGTVKKAGVSSGYADPLVQIRHYRPGTTKCKDTGCYVSNYMHLSEWVVAIGQKVVKGQLIGYTGQSSSGFEHLHFEVRDAPTTDVYSAWQRDAIHPLSVLPYPDEAMDNFIVAIDKVLINNAGLTEVSVALSAPLSIELDLLRVEIDLFERVGNNNLVWLSQPGYIDTGDSGNGGGYNVNPSFYDMAAFNRQFSHKNSSKQSWHDFDKNGKFACPFADEHHKYSPNVHLDHADDNDFQTGDINGVKIAVEHYNANSSDYQLQLTFDQLVGTLSIESLCVQATAVDALGNRSSTVAFNCD